MIATLPPPPPRFVGSMAVTASVCIHCLNVTSQQTTALKRSNFSTRSQHDRSADLRLPCAELAENFCQARRLDAAAKQRVEAFASGRDALDSLTVAQNLCKSGILAIVADRAQMVQLFHFT